MSSNRYDYVDFIRDFLKHVTSPKTFGVFAEDGCMTHREYMLNLYYEMGEAKDGGKDIKAQIIKILEEWGDLNNKN